MTVGADRKRLVFLAAIVVIGGGYAFWTNFSNSDSSPSPAARPAQTAAPAAMSSENSDIDRVQRRRAGQNRASSEWNPAYKDPKSAIDPMKVDPTLRLDLLAKVQRVEIDPAERNLFQFGAAPPPPAPMPPVAPIRGLGPKGSHPTPPQPSVPVVASALTAPPIPLKYYGYANPRATTTRRRAFFLDGEDIIIAGEGELIKKRYKLVKIGVNSVTMEDTQFNNDQQTLPLAQDLAT